MNEEEKIRFKIFEWLNDQIRIFGNVLDTQILNSFVYQGERVFLQGSKGIWKPKQFQFPISIASDPEGKYPDGFISESMMHYSYEGTNPNLWTNAILREAKNQNIPLIYLLKISKGKYFVHFPVFIIKDEPEKLRFTVVAEDRIQFIKQPDTLEEPMLRYLKQEYSTREVKVRMFQQSFRELVLDAYNSHCAICSLRHRELLDAAHIISDSDGGKPLITNGISLCKIHHSAFDENILGINPDYLIEVRGDVLKEIDGPMLKYGIQEMHGNKIILPHSNSKKPDRDFLAQRYEKFRRAM
jgi:putative restriction endonuclease